MTSSETRRSSSITWDQENLVILGRFSPLVCAVYVLIYVLRRKELTVVLVESACRDGVEKVFKFMFDNKTLLVWRDLTFTEL